MSTSLMNARIYIIHMIGVQYHSKLHLYTYVNDYIYECKLIYV